MNSVSQILRNEAGWQGFAPQEQCLVSTHGTLVGTPNSWSRGSTTQVHQCVTCFEAHKEQRAASTTSSGSNTNSPPATSTLHSASASEICITKLVRTSPGCKSATRTSSHHRDLETKLNEWLGCIVDCETWEDLSALIRRNVDDVFLALTGKQMCQSTHVDHTSTVVLTIIICQSCTLSRTQSSQVQNSMYVCVVRVGPHCTTLHCTGCRVTPAESAPATLRVQTHGGRDQCRWTLPSWHIP
jgi:hypothetical protein